MPDMNSILAGAGIPPEDRVVDQLRIQAAVREILLAVGEDPDRDGLKETPARVARMYAEIFGGLHLEPDVIYRRFSKSSMTRWCWFETSHSTACANIICCHSWGKHMSGTSREEK